MWLHKERWNNQNLINMKPAISQQSNFLMHTNPEINTKDSSKNWRAPKYHSTSFRKQLIWLIKLNQSQLNWIRKSNSIRGKFFHWKARINDCNLKMINSLDRVCMRCKNNSKMMENWKFWSQKLQSCRNSSRLWRKKIYLWLKKMKKCLQSWRPKMLRSLRKTNWKAKCRACRRS